MIISPVFEPFSSIPFWHITIRNISYLQKRVKDYG